MTRETRIRRRLAKGKTRRSSSRKRRRRTRPKNGRRKSAKTGNGLRRAKEIAETTRRGAVLLAPHAKRAAVTGGRLAVRGAKAAARGFVILGGFIGRRVRRGAERQIASAREKLRRKEPVKSDAKDRQQTPTEDSL